MSLSARRLLQFGAFALLAALVTGLVLALVHEPSAARAPRSSVRAQLSPRDPQFGDTVVATVRVVTPSDVDPGSVRVHADFRPYAVVSTTRSVSSGSGVRIESRLRCLELKCVPQGRVSTFQFKPARISYGDTTVAQSWPSLHVHSRVTKADISAPVLRVPPPVAAPASYRVSPSATGYALLALAGLLAAAGAALLLRVALKRFAPPRRQVPTLERVLAELAASCSNGDLGRRRRALEELACELEPLDEPLSIESRVLAWGPSEPKPAVVSELAGRVRTAVRA